MGTATAYLGLGSNLGDRIDHLRRAVRLLHRRDGIRVAFPEGVASVWRTAPVDVHETQPDYLNTAIRILTTCSPRELLDACLEVERAVGRIRRRAGEARIIDIDVLLIDGMVLNTEGVTLPHPRLHARRFVLEPLCEIAPALTHPAFGLTVAEMADALRRSTSQVVKRYGDRSWHGLADGDQPVD